MFVSYCYLPLGLCNCQCQFINYLSLAFIRKTFIKQGLWFASFQFLLFPFSSSAPFQTSFRFVWLVFHRISVAFLKLKHHPFVFGLVVFVPSPCFNCHLRCVAPFKVFFLGSSQLWILQQPFWLWTFSYHHHKVIILILLYQFFPFT